MSDRERELEAEIERWRAKWAEADKAYWALTHGELLSLREQNATLRAEIQRLQQKRGEA